MAVERALVLGGNGFVGRHLVEDLIALKKQVYVFDVRKSPDYELDPNLRQNVKKFYEGDLTNVETVLAALKESQVDTIFHCATPSPFAPAHILHKVNIEGSKTLLACCKEAPNVKSLILTSSASVVYSGNDVINADEKTPYATKGHSPYTDSKIAQEKFLLEANNKEEYGFVKIVSIRPASIFGERDLLFYPALIKAAKDGKTKFRVGNRQNDNDFTYVKNVSHGLLLAAEKIDKVAGEAFFITNDEPIPFWDYIGSVWETYGAPKPTICIPLNVMWVIGMIVSFIYWLIAVLTAGHVKLEVPAPISPEKLSFYFTYRTHDISKAKKLLGYKPLLNMKEATKKTVDWFIEQDKK